MANDDMPVSADAPFGRFRCDPFACRRVCCTGWPAGGGIRLTLRDLLRLDKAGLLESADGAFASASAIAAWRADPEARPRPESPRMRSVDGNCVHYDHHARRCTIWEHRPAVCRNFPYAVDYVSADGEVHVTFAAGCSLVTPAADQTPIARGDAIPVRFLAIKRPREPQRLDELPEYDRRHVEDVLVRVAEQAVSLELATRDRARVVAMGLGRFLEEGATETV